MESLLAYDIPFIVSLNSVQMVLSPSSKQSMQAVCLFHRKNAGNETLLETLSTGFSRPAKPEPSYVISKLVFLHR